MPSANATSLVPAKRRASRLAYGAWVLCAVLALAGAGCATDTTGEADVGVAILGLENTAITSIEVTVTGAGIATPIVAPLVRASNGVWSVSVGAIPAGIERVFTVVAYDAGHVALFTGQSTGISVYTGETTQVKVALFTWGTPSATLNDAPFVDSIMLVPATLAPGEEASVSVTAHDPDAGDSMTYVWTATAGSFADPTAMATRWTAPAVTGSYALSLTARDSRGATRKVSITATVNTTRGNGGVTFDVGVNTWPDITAFSTSPTLVAPGKSATVRLTATDADRDTVTKIFSDDCGGTFGGTTWTAPAVAPASGVCTLHVDVSDGRDGSTSGALTILVGTNVVANHGPVVTSSFLSVPEASAGQKVSLNVGIKDPDGQALRFHWSATSGTFGAISSSTAASTTTWMSDGRAARLVVRATDPFGAFTELAFDLARVSTAPTGYGELAAGAHHTCGVRLSDGQAQCWGANADGQSTPPVGVAFVHLSGGGFHTCGIRQADGEVQCWGSDTHGQSSPPAGVAFEQLAAGWLHTCGMRSTDHQVQCWGDPSFGQATPPAGVAFSEITVGSHHGCGLREVDGSVQCWGDDGHGQSTPPSGAAFASLFAGGYHTCGRRDDGTVACWGDGAYNAQATAPAGVVFLAVGAGGYHNCGLRQADNKAQCWGYAAYGQATPSTTVTYRQLVAGEFHSCGIRRTDGQAQCWGVNTAGELNATAAY